MAHDCVWARADNVLSALFLNLYHRGRERILAEREPNDKESNWDQQGANNFQCIRHTRKLPALGIERHEDEPAKPNDNDEPYEYLVPEHLALLEGPGHAFFE